MSDAGQEGARSITAALYPAMAPVERPMDAPGDVPGNAPGEAAGETPGVAPTAEPARATPATSRDKLERRIASLTGELDLANARIVRLEADKEAMASQIAALLAAAGADTAPDPAPEGTPHEIRLIQPFGFIEDETGRHRQWAAGEVIIDWREIVLLTERGAAFEVTRQPADEA